MQATLCLRAPQGSTTLHCPRSTLYLHSGYHHHHYSLALRSTVTFSHGGLCAVIRSQKPSSTPPPHPSERKNHKNALVSVSGTVAVAVALACAVALIPSWSRRGSGLAASWYSIPIQGSADRGRPDPKRDTPRKEQQKALEMKQQQKAPDVLQEMFERKDLSEKFFKIIPNYPKIKEYFEDHLRLGDQAWETLISKWKEIKPGPDQIEIGLLLVDIYIIKGNAAGASDMNKEIIKNASESDQRPLIRKAFINMIKDWEKKKEGEKKKEWENFVQEIQEIANSPFSGRDEPDEGR